MRKQRVGPITIRERIASALSMHKQRVGPITIREHIASALSMHKQRVGPITIVFSMHKQRVGSITIRENNASDFPCIHKIVSDCSANSFKAVSASVKLKSAKQTKRKIRKRAIIPLDSQEPLQHQWQQLARTQFCLTPPDVSNTVVSNIELAAVSNTNIYKHQT